MQTDRQYERIARAIDYLQTHHREQPSLTDIAAAAQLSPSHFRRVCRAWAGVSPRQFLPFLTPEHARSLLADDATIKEPAYATGLSHSGRQDDLSVSIARMMPGEFGRAGSALRINAAIYPSRFGRVIMASTVHGICTVSFLDDNDRRGIQALEHRFPRADIQSGEDAHQRAALSWFAGSGTTPEPVPLHLNGTPFQIRVWESLLRIPAGRLETYSRVASYIGKPGASRAVGRAIGCNPVALLIPCHRVIRSSGALGGYRWGLPRKAALIGWESAQDALQ